jgi:hypothetical protein
MKFKIFNGNSKKKKIHTKPPNKKKMNSKHKLNTILCKSKIIKIISKTKINSIKKLNTLIPEL